MDVATAWQACIDGSVEMVKVLLLEFAADVNSHAEGQFTPLHTVALCGHSIIAQQLIGWYVLWTTINTGGIPVCQRMDLLGSDALSITIQNPICICAQLTNIVLL